MSIKVLNDCRSRILNVVSGKTQTVVFNFVETGLFNQVFIEKMQAKRRCS